MIKVGVLRHAMTLIPIILTIILIGMILCALNSFDPLIAFIGLAGVPVVWAIFFAIMYFLK